LNTFKLTEEDLRKWRPPERGRQWRAAVPAATAEPEMDASGRVEEG
jgi:hypothetical protein